MNAHSKSYPSRDEDFLKIFKRMEFLVPTLGHLCGESFCETQKKYPNAKYTESVIESFSYAPGTVFCFEESFFEVVGGKDRPKYKALSEKSDTIIVSTREIKRFDHPKFENYNADILSRYHNLFREKFLKELCEKAKKLSMLALRNAKVGDFLILKIKGGLIIFEITGQDNDKQIELVSTPSCIGKKNLGETVWIKRVFTGSKGGLSQEKIKLLEFIQSYIT